MSSSESTYNTDTLNIEVLFNNRNEDSSEEPPKEEWSSLNFEPPEENIKRLLYEKDLYCPGSGEICTKYITLSASSVLRHPYYTYPGIVDPGIEEALLFPEPKPVYPDDGQELYLILCKENKISPIQSFYRQLLEEVVSLRYYGIHPMGFRAIALSLLNNSIVNVLDLTDNWISIDGCYHLGEMISINSNLKELNLYGCRIGPEGAKQLFANLHVNRSIRKINLTKNCLTDVGIQYLSKAIFLGSDVTNLNLSFNDLTAKALLHLAESFERHNKLTHLDLSWNKILSPNAVFQLCTRLSENKNFEEINLSWNSLSGLRIGNAIKKLMNAPNLKSIYINNNKLSTTEVAQILCGLQANKSLNTLDLSYNPLTPKDAFNLLLCLKDRKVKLQRLLLENIFVTTDFLYLHKEILSLKFRKGAIITWGGIITKIVSSKIDMREIVLNRAETLCKRSKRKPIDIALIILELHQYNKGPMGLKDFSRELKSKGVVIDEDLIEEITNSFPGPSTGKAKTVNLVDLTDYVERKWPDRMLQTTPLEIAKGTAKDAGTIEAIKKDK